MIHDAEAAASNANPVESESDDEALELAEALNQPGGTVSTTPAAEPLKQLDVVSRRATCTTWHSYVPDGFKQGFSACVGGLNIFCGILGTLMSFLKYAEVYEAHRIAAVAWSSLGRNIEIELALKEERRKNCRDFLKVSRAEYDRLLESSPTIDQDIIALFNKRFNKDYPGDNG